MNKKKEMIERNIELSAEFSRYLFDHPEMEEKIPWMQRWSFYQNSIKN